VDRAQEIGRGGIGRVLLAMDGHLGREVALKELLPERGAAGSELGPSSGLSTAMLRFLREARVTGQLEHPNIVPVYELGKRADGTLYYTMKMVRGRTLGAAFGAAPELAGRLALLKHFVDLCQAIGYAHSRGVVHRDIKPENVMLGEFGETVVLDWGLAKVRGQRDLRARELEREVRLLQDAEQGQTLAGTAVGTPAYMSPEQAEGDLDRVDERSDVWSLGAVLYQLLAGRPPFSGRTAFEVIGQVLRGQVRPVGEVQPDAPPELAAVCMKALARRPEARYGGAAELAREVEAFLTGGRVAAHEYRLGELVRRFARRHRGPLAVALAAALALAGLGVANHLRVLAERNRAVRAEEDARARLAESLREGARAAWLARELPETRAHLRSALQLADSLAGRGQWLELQQSPLVWRKDFGQKVWDAAFSPDGRVLAVGAEDGQVYLVDAVTSRAEVLRGYGPQLLSVAWSADGRRLAAGPNGGPLHIWDLEAGTRRLLEDHHEGLKDLAWSPDGTRILTGSWEGTLRVFDARSGALLGLREGLSPWTAGVAWSPDGATVWAGQAGGGLRAFGPDLAVERPGLRDTGELASLALSPDGRRLVLGCEAGRARLFRLPELREEREFGGLGGVVKALAFESDGRHLLLAEGGRVLRIETDTGREVWSQAAEVGAIESLAVMPASQRLAVGGRQLALWRTDQARSPSGHQAALVSLAFSPDGRRLASGSGDRSARVWDVETGALRGTLALAQEGGVAWTPDGAFLATSHGELRLWEAEGLRLARRLPGGGGECAQIAFSADGRRALVAEKREALLVDVRAGRVLARLPLESEVAAFHAGKDAGLVASQRGTGSIELVELASRPGRSPRRWEGHRGWIWQLAFDRAGRWLASAGDDGLARVWSLETSRELHALKHADAVRTVSFHPRLPRLATASNDYQVRLWDLESGAELARLATRDTAEVVQFSADGERLAVGMRSGVWLLRAENLWPIWRGPLLGPGRGGARFSHLGWQGQDPGWGPALRAAVEAAARVSLSPDGRLACLLGPDNQVSLWAREGERPLWGRQLEHPGLVLALDAGCALIDLDPDLGYGRAVRMDARGEETFLAERASALALQGEELWVAEAGYALRCDREGVPLGRRELSLGFSVRAATDSLDGGRYPPERPVSALLPLGDAIVVGERRGQLHRLALSPRGGASAGLVFRDTFSGRVVELSAGPPGTVLAGYNTGQVGLWDVTTGQRLAHMSLHGPVQHLRVEGDRALALSELGDYREMPLGGLGGGWCELLQEVWTEAPDEWLEGRAQPRAPPADHPCRR
jgi:WD40 repeat protein